MALPGIYYCFPEGKHKALTLSYDDGRRADERLVGMFNRYGIRGTFHLNSGLLGQEDRIGAEEVAALYRGHEVSVHTVTHPTMARCPMEQIVAEILDDRKNLERLLKVPVRGMSYPNGSYSKEIVDLLPHLGIEYARTVRTHGGFGLPEDWLRWEATCHHKDRLIERAESFVSLHKKQYLYLMYVWGHSYEFDLDNNWELMERFCELTGGRDDIWYATNIEIVDYMKACQWLKFSASREFVHNPGAASVWLSVDGRVVEVPGGRQVELG
ncbi:polysaccharide deacetylase [Paenibacillus faecis]|uniref:polysaccharide deacetylase family protein n=1 Tax=Paenibacillus faecis TaxID=862114 RepID=UPI001B102300|nr:polysaccharide deacetylase family protein [Paenibacillus faecis]GIO87413.1 polysaccharide deacetylase [Paenibacillus faecis]